MIGPPRGSSLAVAGPHRHRPCLRTPHAGPPRGSATTRPDTIAIDRIDRPRPALARGGRGRVELMPAFCPAGRGAGPTVGDGLAPWPAASAGG